MQNDLAEVVFSLSWWRECWRILYCSFFRPYSYRLLLQDIHPDLEIDGNPYYFINKDGKSKKIQNYILQAKITVFVSSIIMTLMVGLSFGGVFNWRLSFVFIIGLAFGIVLSGKRQAGIVVFYASVLFFSAFILMMLFPFLFDIVVPSFVKKAIYYYSVLFFSDESMVGLIGVAIGAASGIAKGVPVGVGGGVAFGVAFGFAFRAPIDVVGACVIGLMFGLATGVIRNLWKGVLFGIVVGGAVAVYVGVIARVVGGLDYGVFLGVSWIFGVIRIPFWFVETIWLLILKIISIGWNRFSVIPWLPPRYDQLIHLPLPFITGLIVAAYRQDAITAIEFLEYLTTSTNQQKTAVRVMEIIASEMLGQCRNSREVAATVGSLAWLPQPYPEEIGPYLPKFLEIAQGVGASLEATSLYRRLELMKAPMTVLENLRKGLALEKRSKIATLWGGIANHWMGVLEMSRRTLAEEASRSGEIPNPYVAGPPLLPEVSQGRFKGRRDLFSRVEELALAPQPPILLLIGGRRTGKSSSLNYLPEKMGPEWIPLVVDGQGLALSSTAAGLVNELAGKLIEAARKSRNLTLPPPDAQALAADPFPALLAWMERVERVVPGKRFLFCLDEFERLGEVVERGNDRSVLNFLRHAAQHRRNWVILFSGAHVVEELPAYWSDCLINTQSVRISFLEEGEARELIRQPIPDFQDIYDAEAEERLLFLTHRHPYLIQLLCSLLVEHLNRERRTRAGAGDVEAVIPHAFERAAAFFHEWWEFDMGEGGRRVLLRVYQGEPPMAADGPLLHRLVRKEVLERVDGQFRFQVPLMQRYVAKVREEMGV